MPEPIELKPVPEKDCKECGGTGTSKRGGTCGCVTFVQPPRWQRPNDNGPRAPIPPKGGEVTFKKVVQRAAKTAGTVGVAWLINEFLKGNDRA